MQLSESDLQFLEDSLQREAVYLLQHGSTTEDPTYLQNRELFGRVWDALYGAPTQQEAK